MNPFPAAYPSTCSICDEQIKRGDLIVRDQGQYVHDDCPDRLDAVIAGPPCPSCWLVGPCDCDPA